MTGLLISVRAAEEALAATAGVADMIDIKEADRGPLGAASREVWRDVLANVSGGRPVSCALGELVERDVFERACGATGMSFAKVGLAGMRRKNDWIEHWR